MNSRTLFLFLTYMSASLSVTAEVPFQFEESTPAAAAEVNANFDAHTNQINQLQAQIEELQAQMQALTGTLTMENMAGTYQLLQLSIDVDQFETTPPVNAYGLGGSFNKGIVSLSANGQGTYTGADKYQQLTFNVYPIVVGKPDNSGGMQVIQTGVQRLLEDDPSETTNFTWSVEGNVVTIIVPPEDENDTGETLSFHAASPNLFVGGATDQGESTLSIIVRQ